MDWILRGPQIHSTFSSLGYVQADGYHINENCNPALEAILQNILAEDKFLRNYRRNINFGQNIQKDLIPLLIHAKEDKTVDLIIRILVNLTIPIECLLDVEVTARTDFGRHTIFEINNLLASTKVAFTDLRTSKVVVDVLKKNIDVEPNRKLSEEQLNNASNCLLLLRNILHIPEYNDNFRATCNGSHHSVQNQILWNIFSQSVDKVIFKAMTISDSKFYGITMVQLVALLYKDQHIVTLHKLVNNWLETSLSESSEDDESNTSPPDRGSEDSSPLLTSSDPTSDSSDSGSKAGSATFVNIGWVNDPGDSGVLGDNDQPFRNCDQDIMDDDKYASSQNNDQDNGFCDDKSAETNEDHIKLECEMSEQNNKKQERSETSDCGYGTQIENQEIVSTSSNDDELPPKKPIHQKPHNAKQKPNNKPRPSTTLQERKRKKVVKRVKANVINVQGLSHKTPADEDITNVIHEFTVDFLLKGYNSLVKTLYNEILTNQKLEIDTSHFFWLVTYFLKFATQIELDLELIDSVLCFDIVSYLIAEGVNLSEQFELAIKLDGSDLSANIRRQHLVVTSIREFVQATEVYKKIQLTNEADQETIKQLQIKMSETEDLRSLLVLLLRHYNPKYHTKQYLQDLVVTNHILLMFLDNVTQIPDYNCSTKMIDHIRQFATPAIMAQYGRLLEDFYINGEFVNDCIFTLMHHVGGDGDRLDTLFQPNILKTFSTIWKSEFEICDDWNDLIENVIHTFIRKPDSLCGPSLFLKHNGKDNKLLFIPAETETSDSKKTVPETTKISNNNIALQNVDNTSQERWSKDDIATLNWNYLQCSANPDVIGAITKQLKEDNIDKSKTSVIRELFRQNLITKEFYESQLIKYSDKNTPTVPLSKESRDEEIRKACEQLILDGKSDGLEWVQKILLEICYAKLLKQRKELQGATPVDLETKFKNFECFKNKHDDMPIVSPVVYHSLITQESVPLVPWNCQQANFCKDLKFLQLLHKLGFQMPVDTGRVFIRIPHFWTAEFIYTIAGKLRPIDTSTLKFAVCELSNNDNSKTKAYQTSDATRDDPFGETSDNLYQIHKQNLGTMVNFTPRPASTFTSANAIEQLTWLQMVKKSQQCKLTLNLESITEAATEEIIMKSTFGNGGSTSVLKSQVTAINTAGLVMPLPCTPYMSTTCARQPTTSVMLPPTSIMLPTTSIMLPITSIMLPTTSIMMTTSVMKPTISDMLLTTCVMRPTTSVMLSSASVMEPTTSVMKTTTSDMLLAKCVPMPIFSIKQVTASDYMQQEDCFYGECETASVASDLTRMYVSDADEKPDFLAGHGSGTTSEPTARKKIKRVKRHRVIKRIKSLHTTVGPEKELKERQ